MKLYRLLAVSLFAGLLTFTKAGAVPVEPPTPVASWLFDEGTGSSAAPFHGTVTGTLTGDAAWSTNTPLSYAGNRSLSFDGTGDWVDMGTDSLLSLGNNLTVSAFVQTSATNSAGFIVGKAGGSSNKFYTISIGTGGSIAANTFNGGTGAANVAAAAGTLMPGQWYHLAYAYDGQFGRLYVDGVLVDTSAEFIRSSTQSGTTGFQVAARNNGNDFPGLIDEVAVWDSGLSADNIEHLALYGLNFTLTQPAPIPEPGSFALLGLGLLGMVRGFRRRKGLC